MRQTFLVLSFVVLGCSKSSATTASSDAGTDTGAPLLDAGPCTSPDFTGNPIGVHCNQLVDSLGRTVVLHGMNARVPVVFDNAWEGGVPHEPIPAFGATDVARMRSIGFNTL